MKRFAAVSGTLAAAIALSASPAVASTGSPFSGKPKVSGVKLIDYTKLGNQVMLKFNLRPAAVGNTGKSYRKGTALIETTVATGKRRLVKFTNRFPLPVVRRPVKLPHRVMLKPSSGALLRRQKSPLTVTSKVVQRVEYTRTKGKPAVASITPEGGVPSTARTQAINTTEIDIPTPTQFETVQLPAYQANYQGNPYLIYFNQDSAGDNYVSYFSGNGANWSVAPALGANNVELTGYVGANGTFAMSGTCWAGVQTYPGGALDGQINPTLNYLDASWPTMCNGYAEGGSATFSSIIRTG